MLQGVLIDQAIEVLFQLARDFGRSTGARAIHQSLCALVGKAVDPFPQTVHSRRTIPLLDICQAALRHHRIQQAEEKLRLGPGYTDQGLVFCRANGAPIDPGPLDRAFRLALKRAGVPAIRLHDARHTFATWMLEQGVSLKVVQTILEYSTIKS
jgi:integrase